MKMQLKVGWLGLGLAVGLGTAQGALYTTTYTGNGNTDALGVVGNGQLTFSDNGGSSFSTTFAPGNRFFNDCFILFIDSQAGGFADTTSFADSVSGTRCAISGVNAAGARASAYFAAGFHADYALVLAPNYDSALYRLASGGDYSLERLSQLWINDAGGQYQFYINWSDLGITGDAAHYFRFQSTYVGGSGSRSLESFETLTGLRGFNPVTFDYWNSFGIEPVPEPVNAALGIFGSLAVVSAAAARARRRRVA